MTIWQTLRMSMDWLKGYLAFLLWRLRRRPLCQKGYISAGDIKIYYQSFGKGEPVLLLHGGFGYLETWCGQIPALAERYRVLAMDSRGHGRTTLGREKMSYRQLARDALQFIEALNLGPVHLVGWSDGGSTGLYLALMRPDLLRSITLIGTPFHTDNYTEKAKKQIRKFLHPASLPLLVVLSIRQLLSPERRLKKVFLERMTEMWTTLPDLNQAQLETIRLPVLVAAADKDEFLSLWPDPLRVFKETANLLPGGRMATFPGGTHSVHMSHRQEFNKALLSFLENV